MYLFHLLASAWWLSQGRSPVEALLSALWWRAQWGTHTPFLLFPIPPCCFLRLWARWRPLGAEVSTDWGQSRAWQGGELLRPSAPTRIWISTSRPWPSKLFHLASVTMQNPLLLFLSPLIILYQVRWSQKDGQIIWNSSNKAQRRKKIKQTLCE